MLGASAGDFVDEDGKVLPVWEAYFGAVWALENPEAKVEQFSAAQLSNFETIVNHYAGHVSATTGLPFRFFGLNSANPPSADGIRADESRLIKRAERRQRAWGGSWERVARLIRRFQTGDWDPSLLELESIWRDPATPTKAQTADAVVKKVQAGILPIEAAWEELGYSQTRISTLRRMRRSQITEMDALARAAAAFQVPTPADDDVPADADS